MYQFKSKTLLLEEWQNILKTKQNEIKTEDLNQQQTEKEKPKPRSKDVKKNAPEKGHQN